MHGAHEYLKAIAVVFCVAAAAAVLFQRLRLPVVLGYILSGLIVGPYVPIPLVADRAIVQTLSELGVILFMFALGLEFSLRKIAKVGPTAAVIAVIETSFMVWLGFSAAKLFGWNGRESIFAGAIIAISSTTIIAKAFDEQRVPPKLRELVIGVLIVEDLIAILLMATLTAVSSGAGVSAATLARSSGKLVAFLVGLLSVGMIVVPRTIRAINRLGSPETSLIGSVAFCFGIALLAHEFGYSVALGAFIAGSLVAESGEEKLIERLVKPVRDLFAVIFFVSVGMLIDPSIVAREWRVVSAFSLLVVFGKVVGVSIGAFLTGNGIRTSVQAGMSLAQIGEFSFIIAALGFSLGATRDFLPLAVAVSVVTSLTTPWLVRAGGPVASFVDRKLPQPLQTFAALFGTWVEQLRRAPDPKTTAATTKRLVRRLLVDAAVLIALVIGASMATEAIASYVAAKLGVSHAVARVAVILAAVALATPLGIGIFRVTRGLGSFMAQTALPAAAHDKVDLAVAPRRALVVTLQLAIVLVVGLPILAIVQPVVGGWSAGAILGGLIVVLGVVFWRSATNLHGHVKAGAEMIVEALLLHAKKRTSTPDEDALELVKHVLPGMGEPLPFRIPPSSIGVGKTLAQLDLRGRTGASVLAIARGEEGATIPTASEVLREGDVLALVGTKDAVAAAVTLLTGGRPSLV